mmetsp:Transcript_2247/g.5947  ORF Transcript_2247/g.5947 Transcript_2247/m.5947 type:complete len:206 (-) Transcript_2247:443-1060(-)
MPRLRAPSAADAIVRRLPRRLDVYDFADCGSALAEAGGRAAAGEAPPPVACSRARVRDRCISTRSLRATLASSCARRARSTSLPAPWRWGWAVARWEGELPSSSAMRADASARPGGSAGGLDEAEREEAREEEVRWVMASASTTLLRSSSSTAARCLPAGEERASSTALRTSLLFWWATGSDWEGGRALANLSFPARMSLASLTL